jgi:hypothetical protein
LTHRNSSLTPAWMARGLMAAGHTREDADRILRAWGEVEDAEPCSTCGEPLRPTDEVVEVHNPAANEVTSRRVHVSCMTPEEEIA